MLFVTQTDRGTFHTHDTSTNPILMISCVSDLSYTNIPHPFRMGFTYDFYANRWRTCSISYYFRNSSASINNVTNVNYDIDLQKMYMYSCKMPQMLCLTR
jgi:hypothetical protein